MQSHPRVTQRAPKSCTECTRRRIRCTKEIPCRPCIARGQRADCRREVVLLRRQLEGYASHDSSPAPAAGDGPDEAKAIVDSRAAGNRLELEIRAGAAATAVPLAEDSSQLRGDDQVRSVQRELSPLWLAGSQCKMSCLPSIFPSSSIHEALDLLSRNSTSQVHLEHL